jgi:hypothetical protein
LPVNGRVLQNYGRIAKFVPFEAASTVGRRFFFIKIGRKYLLTTHPRRLILGGAYRRSRFIPPAKNPPESLAICCFREKMAVEMAAINQLSQ